MKGFGFRMIRLGYLVSLSFLLSVVAVAAETAPPADWISYYATDLPLTDVYAKLVDNHGDGRDDLYGTRNFRVVLTGVLYRGGGNNAFNKHGTRANRNPLPTEGLNHLCQQGFQKAIYLYPNNFNSAPKDIKCQSPRGEWNLKYQQQSPFSSSEQAHAILQTVYQNIQNYEGPIYAHCWNGWHASGYVSALALRQFCDYSGDEAVRYWDKNTDGNDREADFAKIRSLIRAYVPDPQLSIDPLIKHKICLAK